MRILTVDFPTINVIQRHPQIVKKESELYIVKPSGVDIVVFTQPATIHSRRSPTFVRGSTPIPYPGHVALGEPQFLLDGWMHDQTEAGGTLSPGTLGLELCREKTQPRTEQEEVEVPHSICSPDDKSKYFMLPRFLTV